MRRDGLRTGGEPGATRPDARASVVGPAWLLRDVTHVPGVLTLEAGRCRFVSTRRVVFDATPDELGLATSRTRRGRFRLTVDGERVGLAVVRPPGAVGVPAELLTRETDGHRPVGAAPGEDEAAVVVRWERLLVADAHGRRQRAVARARRRAHAAAVTDVPHRRPRAWRAVAAFVPRLPLVGPRPRRNDRPTVPMATV